MFRGRIAMLAVLGLLVVAPPAAALVIGIGDQKTQMFSDARFKQLGIRHVRLNIGWDAMHYRDQRTEIDKWLRAARKAGTQPLVSFGHSRGAHRADYLPSPPAFKHEFARFHHRYPWVVNFATWNEANLCGEPTCLHPRLVALYWNAMRRVCPQTRCRILAAELLDTPNLTWWIDEFRARATAEPLYWGLHNYVDTNRLRTTGTRAMLAATTGQIWFTETGGIVSRRDVPEPGFPQSTRHAALATSWVFHRLVPLSRRITRVYIYNWNARTSHDRWDSALINVHGRARMAFGVLKREIAVLARRAAARIEAAAKVGAVYARR
jgi:hypothetical protein